MTALAMSSPRPRPRPRRILLARFLAFELTRVLRAPSFLLWTLAFPVVFYLVNYANPTDNVHAKSSYGTTWPIFFMVSMCGWAAISAAFSAGGGRLAAERTNGWTRLLRLTPLPSWAYATGKVLTGVSLALVAALALVLVAGAAARPGLTASTFAEVILACWLGSFPFAAIGIFIGLVAGSSTAQPIMIAVTLVLNVLGGLLVPLQAFPQWLRDVARVLPTYRLGQLGWNAVAHRAFDPADVLILVAYGLVFAALAAWRYRADERRPIG
jgi:ABC-2 type transport system permease protein